ncbi:MAG: hypothetical protein QM820_15215 [Minicystis sp.]
MNDFIGVVESARSRLMAKSMRIDPVPQPPAFESHEMMLAELACLAAVAMDVFHAFCAWNRPVPPVVPPDDELELDEDDEDEEDEDDDEDEEPVEPPAPEDEDEEEEEDDEEDEDPDHVVPESGQCCQGYLGPPSGQ